jgi:chromosome segregation ATPase
LQIKTEELETLTQNEIKEIQGIDERTKTIEETSDALNKKLIELKGRIVSSPEKLENLLAQLKSNKEEIIPILEKAEETYKVNSQTLKNLEFLLKMITEKENLDLEWDRYNKELIQIQDSVYKKNEIRNKIDKTINEKLIRLDNLDIEISTSEVYGNEYKTKQLKQIELKEESLEKLRSRSLENNKKIKELEERLHKIMQSINLTNESMNELEKFKEEHEDMIEREMTLLTTQVIEYGNQLDQLYKESYGKMDSFYESIFNFN